MKQGTRGNLNKLGTIIWSGGAFIKSVRELGDWTKCKDRLEYGTVTSSNITESGVDPITCPFYAELDAILETTTIQNTSGEMHTDVNVDKSSPSSSSKSTPLLTPKRAEPKPPER